MRLFLASTDLSFPPGNELAAQLAGLVDPGTCTAIVLNALDDVPDLPRATRLEAERHSLGTLGADAFELDLRDYDEHPGGLSEALSGAGLVWVTGGNAFTLRAAMARSGLDGLLTERLAEDSIGYGGYSAGACAAGPALRGADLYGVGEETVWGGLGLVDFSIVPHYGAGDENFGRIAAHLQRLGLAHRILRDGQAIIVAGETVTLRQ